MDVIPNQEFLDFISIRGKQKGLPNAKMLLNLEANYPGIFIKVMTNFDNAKSYRDTLDENGNPIKVSWENALKNFFIGTRYKGTTEENADIAALFARKGLSQETFDRASYLRETAKARNVPEHILERTIREETILETIKRIKKQTEEELIGGRQMIEELFDKQFTYEWLSKHDPHNSILGLFTSCCGTIMSDEYGAAIAGASIMAIDVQNLVVRNSKGDIIAKGTMYVNKEKGYAVINEFDINEMYKQHETLRSGTYSVDETSPDELDRELIFKAFQRGLEAFIEEYDRQNPNKPLQQINVGMRYNKLKRQVERFKKETSNLTVPVEYKFIDARRRQYILYKREEQQIENGGQDR